MDEKKVPPTNPETAPVQLAEVSAVIPEAPVQPAPPAVQAATPAAPVPAPPVVQAPPVEKPAPVAPKAPPAAPAPAPVASTPKNPAGVPAAPGAVVEPRKSASELMPPPIIIGPVATDVPVSGNRWESDLEQSAASTGVSANLMRKIGGKESGFNPNARASTSSAAGLFQIISSTWDGLAVRYPQLHLTNRMDPAQQARVAPYYMKEIQQNLHRATGRAPTDGESYLGWFLGPVDAAKALQADPNTPVSMVLNPRSIAANPAVFNKVQTIGQLYQWSDGKMGGSGTSAHPAPKIDLVPYLNLGPHSSKDAGDAVNKLQWNLQSGLGNMIADMPEHLRKQIKINSGYRSPETQAGIMSEKIGGMLGAGKRASWDADVKSMGPEAAGQKWATELRSHGITRWVGLPGGSNHQHGNAVDLNIQQKGELQAWVHANAGKYGLRFPMAHEPWHIEAVGGADAKRARMGMQPGERTPTMRVPYSAMDDAERHTKHETQQYSMVQAAQAAVTQDWMVSNMLKANNKAVYDPNFSVTQDLLSRDDVKALPPNYLPDIGKAMSEQDFEFRVKRAQGDYERERRLEATGGSTLLRMAVGMADPAGVALSLISPGVGIARAARAGLGVRAGAAAVDGALGNLAADVPAMLNRPSYEAQEALWAGLAGTAGYLALGRSQWAPHVAPEMEQAVKGLTKVKEELESGTLFSGKSAGAAQVAGYREPVRNDVAGLAGVEVEKTGRKWMDNVRFDFAKMKNSENSLVAKAADLLGMDSVGNRNRDKAITRPVEYDARRMEEKANVYLAREYNLAAEDYKKRNGIKEMDWQRGGEEEFQKLGSAAVRSTDPLAEIDPAVQRYANAWKKTSESWRELARNPGKERGEVMRPLSNAEHWADNPNYLPRYTNWDRFNTVNAEFGSGMKRLFGDAIHARNPDLSAADAERLGGFYYDRLARVEAGQELSVQKALSGSDMEELRRMLQKDGFEDLDIDRLLFEIDAKDAANGGKTLTSRQKPRTLMDENYRGTLTGKNGSREVGVAEIWEDNLRSITHAYNKQMSGAVAMAQFRIENPQWHRVNNPDVPRYIVDGIQSDGDWQKFLAQVRAHDNEIRYGDQLKTVEGEIKKLQWIYDAIRGVPQSGDRSKLGQALRVVQNVNFVRLMSQAGWSSIAEFGNLLGAIGVKHTLRAIPAFGEFRRNALTGRLARDELEDMEYIFGAGTDHLRGSGMTWTGKDHASALNDGGQLSNALDTAERFSKKAARYTSMVSLAPLTTAQERFAMRAVLSKFRGAATEGDALSAKRMRLLGLDADMQAKVLAEIKRHDEHVVGERGNKIRLLGLEKWEPETRSAFEFAVNTWTRRIIQQNDLGQMNEMISSPLGKIIFQFRNFTLGAWSKQTLASLHMRDPEAFFSFTTSMMFGSVAYIAQTSLNGMGLSGEDKEKYLKDRLSDKKIAAAAFQRAGAMSLLPGAFDFGAGILGFDPFFDTRSTQQPSGGLVSNPTFGLIDSVYGAGRDLGKSLHGGDTYTSKDLRGLSRALNVLHNYPIMTQIVNSTSQALPAQ